MADTAGDADHSSEGTISDIERIVTAADSESGSDDFDPFGHESRLDAFLLSNVSVVERKTAVKIERKSETHVEEDMKRAILQEQMQMRRSMSRTAVRLEIIEDSESLTSDSDDEKKKKKQRKSRVVGLSAFSVLEATKLSKLQRNYDDGEISEESDSQSSTSSDASLDEVLQEIAKRAENNKMRLGTALRVAIYDKAGPTTLVELNENQNQQAQHRLIKATYLLQSFDKDIYNVERSILKLVALPQLSNQLFNEKNHPYFGEVTCLRMFQAKNGTLMFVGNSSGYIQVFDLQTQKQKKPLFDQAVSGATVTCLEISADGHYILAGYKHGMLALWDCSKFRLAHLMSDVAKDDLSSFCTVKFLFSSDQNSICVAAAEDSGRMSKLIISRKLLGKFQHQSIALMKCVNTIEVQRLPPKKAGDKTSLSFCQTACLTAFGANDIVTIVDMKSQELRPVKIFKRPIEPIVDQRSVPLLAWGQGLTPQDRVNSKYLLVIVFDKTIKLITVNEQTQDMEMSGYYISDQTINQVYFGADSLLVIVVNHNKIKVLSTEKFRNGTLQALTQNKQPHETIKEIKSIMQSCKVCELEEPIILPEEVRRVPVTFSMEKSRQTGFYHNHHNTVGIYKQTVILACEKSIYAAKLTTWKDFMDKLVHKDGADWLTVLKAALEIYSGEMKGFVMLPSAKEERKAYMHDYMKRLILSSIRKIVNKYHNTSSSGAVASPDAATQVSSSSSSMINTSQIDEVAIKVAVEFCLAISDVKFLFGDIYQFFVGVGLEDLFIEHLCAPLLTGQFSAEYVPEDLLLKLIKAKEEQQEFNTVEQIILNVNLEPYKGKVCPKRGKPIERVLIDVARKLCLVGAALLLLQTSNKVKCSMEGCTMVLNMLLTTMETQKAKMEQAQRRNLPLCIITKDDMRRIRSLNKERKQEVEQSAYYVGYRLFWILGNFLRGKKFPSGNLDHMQHKVQVLNIVDFVTDEDNLCSMLDFDAESFFNAMINLFIEQPWQFISNAGNYKFKNLTKTAKQRKDNADKANIVVCMHPIANRILSVFKETAERFSRKEQAFCKASYQEFVLNIIVSQENDLKTARNKDNYEKVDFEYDLILQSLKGTFKVKKHGEKSVVADRNMRPEVNKQLIIKALKAVELEHDHINELIKIAASTHNRLEDLGDIKIQLFESKHDYQEAFMQHLNQKGDKTQIFSWLSETFDRLKIKEFEWKKEKGFFEEEKEIPREEKKGEAEAEDHHKAAEDQNAAESADDDDAEDGRRKSSAEQVHAEDRNPYPPLAHLKQVVKDRMLKLAQLDTDQTIMLIENHFSEGDFQEKLIMTMFNKYPEQQLQYLKNFITKNEREIEVLMQDSRANRDLSIKYEKYLVQFVKLLCDQEGDSVENWVIKNYFPVEKCLTVCKEAGNTRGEAILTMRGGRPHDAIDVYCRILTEFPIVKLLEQIKLLYKDEPTFLEGLVDGDDEEVQDEDLVNRKGAPAFALQQIANFDTVIGKACKICLLDGLDIEERQKGWFQVLRYLQQFRTQAEPKCTEGIILAIKEVGNKYAPIKEANKQEFVDKLQNFIRVRIRYILKFPGLTIPLKQLVEQFQMTNEQIKELTMHRMQHSDINFDLETRQNSLIMHQSCDTFKSTLKVMGQGFVIEPEKRFLKQGGRRKLIVSTICSLCLESSCGGPDRFITIYACTHQFHKACLEHYQELNGIKTCPVCLKQDYITTRDEIEKQLRQKSDKAMQDLNKDDEEEKEDEEGRQYGQFNEDGDEQERMLQMRMLYKKLDQYDTILDDINLELSEFEAEMAD